MFRENTKLQTAAIGLREAITAEEPDSASVEAAFEEFGNAIAATVVADYESARGDQAILLQRGFRVLTAEERTFYESVIEAGRQPTVQAMNGLLGDKVMPVTIIEDVYKELTTEHPLLAEINFQSVEYLTRWILNDHSVQTAVWGPVNATIAQAITSAFRTIDLAQCKLSAYAVIEQDMLDLGPQFLDGYIRTFLKEAVLAALELAVVAGTGHNQPIGLIRDIHQGVSVDSSTGYPAKTAVSLASFMPKDYGAVLAIMAESEVWYTADATGNVTPASTAANEDGSPKSGYTKHGGRPRNFDEVLLICNQKDYLSKIMPATTVLGANGLFAKDVFPFPTKVVRSSAVPAGKAVACLPKEYFMGVGTGKEGTITYTDDLYFLEDKRAFKIKMHGMGVAYDDTCAVYLDISNLEEAFVYIKAAEALSVTVETPEETAAEPTI